MFNPVATAMRLTKHHMPSALLLMRIAWRARRPLKKKTGGWVAFSQAFWAEETEMTEHQVRRATAYLRQLGLIETKRMMFNGKALNHIRITPAARVMMSEKWDEDDTDQLDKIAPTEPCDTAHTEPCNNAHFIVEGETEGEKEGETGTEPETTPEDGDIASPGEEDMLGDESKEAPLASAKEILEQIKSKKGKAPRKGSKVTTLAEEFKELYAEHTGKMAPHLTGFEIGQIKHFIGKCPEGTALDVLRKVCTHWPDFANAVKSSAGLVSVPLDPKLAFISKYAHIAIDFTPEEQNAAEAIEVVAPKKEHTTFVIAPKPEND